MSMLTEDQLKVKALVAETITQLCKNGLGFSSELRIEGLIGVTIDSDQILLVNINETVLSARIRARSTDSKTTRKSCSSKAHSGLKLNKIVGMKRTGTVSQTSEDITACSELKSSTSGSDTNTGNSNNSLESSVVHCENRKPGSRRVAAKRKRPNSSSETEQTLTLMVEDALLGDQTSHHAVKVEQNYSDVSDVEPEENQNISNACGDVFDLSNTECSRWLTDPDGEAMNYTSDEKLSERRKKSVTGVSCEEPKDYLESYTCPECGLIVRTSVTLRDHIAGKHGQQPRFVCSACGKKFKWRSTFFYHRKSCDPANH